MSEENPKPQKEPASGRRPPVELAGSGALCSCPRPDRRRFSSGGTTQTEEISNKQFLDLLKAGKIVSEQRPVEIIVKRAATRNPFPDFISASPDDE
jgi:hypothetical protein